jgi:hypothetical protein
VLADQRVDEQRGLSSLGLQDHEDAAMHLGHARLDVEYLVQRDHRQVLAAHVDDLIVPADGLQVRLDRLE